MKVSHGFVSFTEVAPGQHRSYNEWHLFDHMAEQLPLRGIVFGQRWVLPPSLRTFARAQAPLDRIHYVTLYLMAEPMAETLREFRELAVELRALDRFHLHRTSHLSGPVAVHDCRASPRALVSAEAVPYRPHRGVHVRIARGEHQPDDLADRPGVAGVWTFSGDELSPPELRHATIVWCWLDSDPSAVAPDLATDAPSLEFSATFSVVDPFGSWDWFDAEDAAGERLPGREHF